MSQYLRVVSSRKILNKTRLNIFYEFVVKWKQYDESIYITYNEMQTCFCFYVKGGDFMGIH